MGQSKAASRDITLKQFWRDNGRFASLFNDVLFGGQDYIKPDQLQEMDTELSSDIINEQFQKQLKRTRDVVKLSADGTVFQILGIENQQDIHYAMPLRILTYEIMSYLQQADDRKRELKKNKDTKGSGEFLSGWKKNDKLRMCISIVIYWGQKPWDGPHSLADMMEFSAHEQFLREFQNYPKMHLICVNELNPGQLNKLRHEEVQEVFHTVSVLYQQKGEQLLNSLRDVNVEVGSVAAAVTGTTAQFKTVLQEAEEEGKERVNMGGALDGVLQEERTKGKREGILEGEGRGKRILSLNMLKRGFDYKTVAEISEVSVEQVKEWEKESKSMS